MDPILYGQEHGVALAEPAPPDDLDVAEPDREAA